MRGWISWLWKGNIEMQISMSKPEVKCVIWQITANVARKMEQGDIYTKFKKGSKRPEQVMDIGESRLY